jgi:hypothetical protein
MMIFCNDHENEKGERTCGDCHKCCEGYLVIKDLGVERGKPCKHLLAGGCAIYEDRPAACRDFLCEWKRLPSIYPDGMRPDKLGKIIVKQGKLLVVDILTEKDIVYELNGKMALYWRKEDNGITVLFKS